MNNPIIRTVIRTRFYLMSRDHATELIRNHKVAYLGLAEQMGSLWGDTSVTVPPMIGVDPEMRSWSFFQILEHNAIVNRMISHNVEKLSRGEDPTPEQPIDHKTDVLPQGLLRSGPEQIEEFRESVDGYLSMIATLPDFRGTVETPHPVFGLFDAHKWHCMFGFHLGLHLKQAEKVLPLLGKISP